MNDDWKTEADSIVLQIKDHFQKYGKRFLSNQSYLNIYKNSRSYLNFIIKLSSGIEDIDTEYTAEAGINNYELTSLQQQIQKLKEEKDALQNEIDLKKSNSSNQICNDLQKKYDDLQKMWSTKYNELKTTNDNCRSNEQALQSQLNKCKSDFDTFKTNTESEKRKLNQKIHALKLDKAKMIDAGTNLRSESNNQIETIKRMISSLATLFNKPYIPGTSIDTYLQEIATTIHQQTQSQSSLGAILDRKNQLLKDISKIKLTGKFPVNVAEAETEIDLESDNVLTKFRNLFETQVYNLLEPHKQIKKDISQLFLSGHEMAKSAVKRLKDVLDSATVEKLYKYLNAHTNSNLMSLLDTLLKDVNPSNEQNVEINKMVGELVAIAQRYEFLIRYINSKKPDTFRINSGKVYYKQQHVISEIEVTSVVDFFRYMVEELDNHDKVAIGRAYDLLRAYFNLIGIITPSASIENINFDRENTIIYTMLQIYKVAAENQVQDIFTDTSRFLRIINNYREWRRTLLNFALLYSNNQMLAVLQHEISDETITFIYDNAIREFPQIIISRYLNVGINQNIHISNYLAQFLQLRQNEINNAIARQGDRNTITITEIPSIESTFLSIENNPSNTQLAIQEFANNNMDVSTNISPSIPLHMGDAHSVIPLSDFDSSSNPIVLFNN